MTPAVDAILWLVVDQRRGLASQCPGPPTCSATHRRNSVPGKFCPPLSRAVSREESDACSASGARKKLCYLRQSCGVRESSAVFMRTVGDVEQGSTHIASRPNLRGHGCTRAISPLLCSAVRCSANGLAARGGRTHSLFRPAAMQPSCSSRRPGEDGRARHEACHGRRQEALWAAPCCRTPLVAQKPVRSPRARRSRGKKRRATAAREARGVVPA